MHVIKNPTPPKGLNAFLFRLPIQLYRLRLGWLLGSRFLRLTHTGRVSGKKREVVIEVVGRDNRAYYACSGFGTRADWYRNVLATPEVTIQVGPHRTRATARPLGADDGETIMAHYAMQHPKLAIRLCRLMGFAVDGTEADFRAVG
ncbi:MAG: nitroreductase family deazaflavin-dependent oxidoreductase, partial [Pseudonocardia sp.]|nr:nitroreductase family deazaflavin-dependent oxidoreductase [Pseudonocardia sp.]